MFKFLSNVQHLSYDHLPLLFIILDLVLKADLKADSVGEDEDGQLFIEVFTY